ncbi:unnamed protein product [Clonostachys rosea f. rosea IK726]|uniref:Uncharacterized protein n=2 Tax=Bionectria ochroleuca TaxID=29856 RepID=A0A0B7KBZ2_BIOOC|nr:unnamed protein product [Clonostachys rosea f. rosea IK726]
MSARPRNLPLHANAENCTGRTFIVTGANSGLGYEVTKHLVGAGASKVIMAVRNTDSGKAAKSQIAAELGHEGIAAEVWPIDLASYASVKAFAKRATEELSRIDALIENAGVFDFKRIMAEGHLSTVTVNILSPFLLALLLLPKLKETAENSILPPHIVFVGSSYGFKNEQEWNLVKDDPLAKMDANGLAEVPVDTHQTYSLTKLVVIMGARQLAQRLPVSTTGVVINTVAPGLCMTNLARNGPPEFQNEMAKRVEMYGRTAEQGSRTLLHAAFAGRESHGRYLDSCQIADDRLPDWMTNGEGEASESNTWNAIVSELEIAEPGMIENVLKVEV